VETALRGRVRRFTPDTDTATVAGAEGTATANTASWIVTTERNSGVTVGRVLSVIHDRERWTKRLRVVGVRGPKSAYVADQLACIETK
jgi:hypothetical protein